MPNHPPIDQQLTPDREQKIRRNYADSQPDGTVPLLLGEIDRLRAEAQRLGELAARRESELIGLRERHKASLRHADQINNELMEEVQRYAEGAERPVLWSVYNRMHSRAAHADAALDRVRRIVRRLAAHAVGFRDVLDESDRGPWGRTVGADIAELSAAVAPDAASEAISAPLSPVQPSSVSESAQSPTGAPMGRLGGLSSTEDLASADDPTPLRWGLNDVLWSDDDSVIVLLSGPDREPYWLELDPERAAVLREDLADPDGAPSPDRDALVAELLPAWEAMYEPGNVSDYLIGYMNDEHAATGAAEAWMRSQSEVTGRLEWVPWGDVTPMPDGYDRWFELAQQHDDGIDTGPRIVVRRRVQPDA